MASVNSAHFRRTIRSRAGVLTSLKFFASVSSIITVARSRWRGVSALCAILAMLASECIVITFDTCAAQVSVGGLAARRGEQRGEEDMFGRIGRNGRFGRNGMYGRQQPKKHHTRPFNFSSRTSLDPPLKVLKCRRFQQIRLIQGITHSLYESKGIQTNVSEWLTRHANTISCAKSAKHIVTRFETH